MRYWVLALGIWMLLYAILAITNIVVEQQKFIMGILAAIVAVLIFIEWRAPHGNP